MNTFFAREPGLSRFLLLGLSPVLLVSDSLLKALVLGCYALLVLVSSSAILRLIEWRLAERQLPAHLQLLAALLTIMVMTVAADITARIFFYPVYKSLPVFPALIAGSTLILQQTTRSDSLLRVCSLAVSYLLLMLVFAGCRELLISGQLLQGLPQVFAGAPDGLTVFENYRKLVLLQTPAGALLGAGLLLALMNFLRHRYHRLTGTDVPEPVKRARVTARAPQQIESGEKAE